MSKEQIQELRDSVRKDIAARAQKDFTDTRYDWLRPLPRRRALVVFTTLLLLAYGVGMFWDWPVLSLLALLAYMGSIWLLRLSVRGITDYPDDIVDERMREIRGYTYRYAFLGTMMLMSVYMVSFIINQLLVKFAGATPMTAENLHDGSFLLFFACMALPSALFAWMEPEV